MISSLKERKKYRILDQKEIDRFIKKTSKRKFNYKDFIKTEEDWWDFANFCMHFHEWDTPCTKMRRNLLDIQHRGDIKKEITSLFFPKHVGLAIGHWDRGPRQSFTYKFNRVSEHISDFCSWELRHHPEYGPGYGTKRTLFNIGSIFVGRSRGGKTIDAGTVGVVEANTSEDAELQLKMFVYPMIGYNPAKDEDNVYVVWCGYISYNQKMDAFLWYNAEMIERRKDHLFQHGETIEKAQKRINVNNLVIETARSNLLANIQSNQPSDEIV